MQDKPRQIVDLITTDIFIAGGGPAGLACAIAFAQRGHQVLVVDGMKPPIDKACGEGLMPDGIAALRLLGMDFKELLGNGSATAAAIRGIRFVNTADGGIAEACFNRSMGCGSGIKRKALHQLLTERAIELGVTLSWETVVQGFTKQGRDRTSIMTNRGECAARFLIGADGQRSRIRSFAGLDRSRTTARRVALRQHFSIAPWTDLVEVYWSDHGQAYVTPVSEAEVCVAFVSCGRFAGGVSAVLANFPQLLHRLSNAKPAGAPRGAVTYCRKLLRVTLGNVALVGDASGSVDAVTGEGLSLAFRQAIALADAVDLGDLRAYERSHRQMCRMPHFMASVMLVLDRSPFLRSRSIALFARLPRLFATLLALHVGRRPASLSQARSSSGVSDAVLRSAPVSGPSPHNAVP